MILQVGNPLGRCFTLLERCNDLIMAGPWKIGTSFDPKNQSILFWGGRPKVGAVHYTQVKSSIFWINCAFQMFFHFFAGGSIINHVFNGVFLFASSTFKSGVWNHFCEQNISFYRQKMNKTETKRWQLFIFIFCPFRFFRGGPYCSGSSLISVRHSPSLCSWRCGLWSLSWWQPSEWKSSRRRCREYQNWKSSKRHWWSLERDIVPFLPESWKWKMTLL